jgi:hypothetical protein
MQNNPILFYAVVLMQSHIIINKVEQEAVQCPERCTMFDGIDVDESAEKNVPNPGARQIFLLRAQSAN